MSTSWFPGQVQMPSLTPTVRPRARRRFVPYPQRVPENTNSPVFRDYVGPGSSGYASSGYASSESPPSGLTSSGRRTVGQAVSSAVLRPRTRPRPDRWQRLSRADRARYAGFMAGLRVGPSPLIPVLPTQSVVPGENYIERMAWLARNGAAARMTPQGHQAWGKSPEPEPQPLDTGIVGDVLGGIAKGAKAVGKGVLDVSDGPRMGRPSGGYVRYWGLDPVTAYINDLAKIYSTGKMFSTTGSLLYQYGGGPGSISHYQLPGKAGAVQRFIQTKGARVAKLADPLGWAASTVNYINAEAQHARNEISDFQVWRARVAFALKTASKAHPLVGMVGLGLGWDKFLNEQWETPEEKPERSERRARGGRVGHGETTLVGERGPEIVRLPAGSDVIPAHRSRELLERAGSASGPASRGQRELHVHQHLDGREIARSTVRNLDDDEQWGRA